ncbi:MAG TPA: hypothetical protein VFK04_12845 [Gemmatimonadaceae bacterium]|nr:hypothetical protein [Gemmatimonadaceae bacterium]
MLDLTLALACLVLAALLVVAFWLTTREPRRPKRPALRPVTVTDGEVEEIGGGAQ